MRIFICDKCGTQSEPSAKDTSSPREWRNLYVSDNRGGRITINICPTCIEGNKYLTDVMEREAGWEDTFRDFIFECMDDYNDRRAGV